ncbi:MAG: hypothetical protein ABI614_20860 [Planctomycetota bacterium]
MGKERLYYEEFKGGQWLRINLFSEMTGNGWRNPQDVIEFPTQNEWASLPEWAHGRREEIVARIKSELREPRYDYKNG